IRLKKYGLRGFIGEYGIPNNPNANNDKEDAADNSQWNTVLNNAMLYMKSQGIGGTAWSYGSSWGNNRLSVYPNSDGSERPQMQVLEQYLFADPISSLPRINSSFVVNYNVANAVSYQLTATNNPTSFTVTGLPSTLNYDNTEHKITGTIPLGEHTINVYATNSNGDGEVRQVVLRGVELKIPGIIEAENYNSGGQGIGYFDKSIGNSGNNIYRDEDVDLRRSGTAGNYIYSVTHAFGGEWLKYTANVEQAGSYGVKLRYATVTAGSVIRIKMNDVVVAEGIPLAVTQSLNDWKEAYFELSNLTVGQHTLTLEVLSGDVDFDNLNFNLIVPAEVPTNLVATAFGSKRVDLTWNASANSAYYIVERSETEEGPYNVIAQNVVTNSYSDETVSATTTYYYIVKGANLLGESAASTSA
ncbi:carbohydrate-binding protein, partial [Pseudoxanthomonas sp. SGD-10]